MVVPAQTPTQTQTQGVVQPPAAANQAQVQTQPMQAPVQNPVQNQVQPPAQTQIQPQPVQGSVQAPVQMPAQPQGESFEAQRLKAKLNKLESSTPQDSAQTPAQLGAAAPDTVTDPALDPAAPASPDAAAATQAPLQNLAASSDYRSRWAQDSVQVLQENGIQLPQGINYTALISPQDFGNLISQVSSMPLDQLNKFSLPATPGQQGITRGESIHLVLASFGLTEALPGFANQASKFSDLTPSHPAYASIVLAESVHLINGYPDRTIRPNERLSWGEALILVETVYSWRKALPTTAPEWVRNFQKKQNMWYQLIDGFRLLLTLAYVVLALYFLGRTWLKVRRQKSSPYRNFSLGLAIVTLMLGALWISELLFNYALIPREIYASFAMLSVFAGLFLLKLGADIDGDISKPKPQVVIDAGYVTSINHERGELFIKDRISDAHSLALAGSETKILRKTGKKSVESAFLSDVEVGDLVSLRASRLEHESLLQVERLTLVEKAQQQVQEQSQQAIREYVQAPQQQAQQQVNRIVPRRS